MSKYLDKTGLTYFWQKIKAAFMSIFPSHIQGGVKDSGYISATDGSIAFGMIESEEYGLIEADYDGSFAFGWVDSTSNDIDAEVGAYARGAMAHGAVDTEAQILAGQSGSGKGSTARGYATGGYDEEEDTYGHAIIKALGDGSVASGYVSASTDDAQILSSGKGSYAGGFATNGDTILAEGHGSFAHGYYGVEATGNGSHAEGSYTTASGDYSHAEGYNTIAYGVGSHAEGRMSQAYGQYAHAEGYNCFATTIDNSSNTRNAGTNSAGYYTHAEGNATIACGASSHAEGYKTLARGEDSHAEGNNTIASGSYSHSEGYGSKATNNESHAEGNWTEATGTASHAEGDQSKALGSAAHAEGAVTIAPGTNSHAEGRGIVTSIGNVTTVVSTTQYTLSGITVTIEGSTYTLQVGDIVRYNTNYAKVTAISGNTITVNQTLSAAAGNTIYLVKGVSYGLRTHSEGCYTTATENQDHAEGFLSMASGGCAHAEGINTRASGWASHAEGDHTTASGGRSHAEGSNTTASGNYSHTGGYYTTANQPYMTAIGKYNVSGATGDLFVVGDGQSTSARHNAFKVNSDYDSDGEYYVDQVRIGDGQILVNSDESIMVLRGSNNSFPVISISGSDECIRMSTSSSRSVTLWSDDDGFAIYGCNVNVTSGRVNASQGFFQISDINKKNVLGELDLDKAYELIDKCQTILYTLKDDESKKQQVGLIAQEVKQFFPELVMEDKEGSLSLDYSRLTVIILRVLKDIIDRVRNLENR